MLKIKELLKSLVDTQKEINENLIKLNKNTIETIDVNTKRANFRIQSVETSLESNVYTKEQTIETIDKEIDYKKKYEECKNNNSDLLELIEKYCRYNNKYQVLDIFDKIDKEYIVNKG